MFLFDFFSKNIAEKKKQHLLKNPNPSYYLRQWRNHEGEFVIIYIVY